MGENFCRSIAVHENIINEYNYSSKLAPNENPISEKSFC